MKKMENEERFLPIYKKKSCKILPFQIKPLPLQSISQSNPLWGEDGARSSVG